MARLKMLISLLTTFQGRISRKQWWIGFLIIVIVSLPVELYLNPAQFSADPPLLPQPILADTVWSVLWLIPSTAITVKRFNDRDWPWWFGYAFGAAWLVTFVGPYFGLYIDPDAGTANAIAFWLLLASALAATIDNGFVRGTVGPNRYGEDPLVRNSVPATA
jgi:uncharacterized membrane protein YhaH (DUF805 family)